MCRKCAPLEGLPAVPVVLLNKFCSLGDMISACGGVEENIVARIRFCLYLHSARKVNVSRHVSGVLSCMAVRPGL